MLGKIRNFLASIKGKIESDKNPLITVIVLVVLATFVASAFSSIFKFVFLVAIVWALVIYVTANLDAIKAWIETKFSKN